MSVSATPRRLYFALWPDDAVRDAIARRAGPLRATQRLGGRPVRRELLHLTLQFLGETDAPDERLHAAAAGVRVPPFELSLDVAASFGRRRGPVWLGPSRPPPALAELWRQLGAALSAYGVALPDEKPFAPHVTVLRDADRRLAATGVDPVHWPICDFVLVRSHLAPSLRYEVIGRWALPQAADASPR